MSEKRRTRVITTAWGDAYIAELLDLTLPALLAPGNLPVLADAFDVEFVMVTEARAFGWVQTHPSFRAIERICPARLVACDDLIVSRNMYGHSLTHALHRGFEDLGAAMCEWNLLFLNSDFVLADGSYATLVEALRAGDRLIFAPSYCVNSEQVLPALRHRLDPASGAMSVSKREMAALILDARHNSIRAKTVNARIFHMDVSDQFYWYVDEHTLLGRQFPIALVAMRPQRAYLDPISFWDYATLSMAAPSLPRRVLGDSDEFLMLELRQQDRFLDLMRVGEPKIADVAARLGYMTVDQYEMGAYDLTLHARDLPANIAAERAKLAAHVDAVSARLPAASDHFHHQYWTHSIGRFQRARDEWRGARNPNAAAPSVDEYAATAPAGGSFAARVRDWYRRCFGRLPRPTRNHPAWALYRHATAAIDEVAAESKRVLVVASEGGVLKRLFESSSSDLVVTSPHSLRTTGLPEGAARLDLCVLDLDWPAAQALARELYVAIRPAMRGGGRIVLHTQVDRGLALSPKDVGSVARLVPPHDVPRPFFAGGRAVSCAAASFATFLEKRAIGGMATKLMTPLWLVGLALIGRYASARAAATPAGSMSAPCAAITIVVDIRRADDT